LKVVNTFPTFYGTRRFITTFISAHQLSLPEAARSGPYPHILLPEDPSKYYLLIYARVSQVASYSGLCLSSPLYALHATHLIILDFITLKILFEQYRSLSSSLYRFLHSHLTSSLLGPNILLKPYFHTPSACIPPSV